MLNQNSNKAFQNLKDQKSSKKVAVRDKGLFDYSSYESEDEEGDCFFALDKCEKECEERMPVSRTANRKGRGGANVMKKARVESKTTTSLFDHSSMIEAAMDQRLKQISIEKFSELEATSEYKETYYYD